MIGFSADQAVPLDGATLTDRAILAGREALAGRRRGLVSLLPFWVRPSWLRWPTWIPGSS